MRRPPVCRCADDDQVLSRFERRARAQSPAASKGFADARGRLTPHGANARSSGRAFRCARLVAHARTDDRGADRGASSLGMVSASSCDRIGARVCDRAATTRARVRHRQDCEPSSPLFAARERVHARSDRVGSGIRRSTQRTSRTFFMDRAFAALPPKRGTDLESVRNTINAQLTHGQVGRRARCIDGHGRSNGVSQRVERKPH